MPIVNADVAWLNELLGKPYPADVLATSLEQIGCDVEDTVEVSRHVCPECGSLVEAPVGSAVVKACLVCGFESETSFAQVGVAQVIRLDLLAARPDLFDVGGLARALRGIFGLEEGLPRYELGPSDVVVSADPQLGETTSYRPFIRCATADVPPLNATSLVAIMKLQENLHWGMGRDRKLASIGIYDRDAFTARISYRTIDPDVATFVPLGMPGRAMTGRQILTDHPKGAAYRHLLDAHQRYPVLVDDRGQVLSMPPIINSEETKLKPGSRRLFIDVTGISEQAVEKTLNTLVCSLIELGATIGAVRHVSVEGETQSPDLRPGAIEISLDEARKWLGIPFEEASLIRCGRRMRLDVERAGHEGMYTVSYPAFRSDVRHMVDIFEDLAIGWGYTEVVPALVPTQTIGQARQEELDSEIARASLLGLGFWEVMSLPLATEEDHFTRLRRAIPARYARIANPKQKALTVVREHLLSGLLQSLHENRRRPLPLRLFEIDNVVRLEDGAETGTGEFRHVGIVEMGPQAGYASMRSTVDALLREFGLAATYAPTGEDMFIAGRGATLTSESVRGILGELHPAVITGSSIRDSIASGDEAPFLDEPVAYAELELRRVF